MTAKKKLKESALPEPTRSELEILQVLWQNGPSTVRLVNDKLNEQKRAVQYTSTLKLMQIMVEKKLLKRDESNMKHIYSPAIEEQRTKGFLLDRFVDSLYNGSASNLMLQLLGNKKTSKEELNAIRDLFVAIARGQGLGLLLDALVLADQLGFLATGACAFGVAAHATLDGTLASGDRALGFRSLPRGGRGTGHDEGGAGDEEHRDQCDERPDGLVVRGALGRDWRCIRAHGHGGKVPFQRARDRKGVRARTPHHGRGAGSAAGRPASGLAVPGPAAAPWAGAGSPVPGRIGIATARRVRPRAHPALALDTRMLSHPASANITAHRGYHSRAGGRAPREHACGVRRCGAPGRERAGPTCAARATASSSSTTTRIWPMAGASKDAIRAAATRGQGTRRQSPDPRPLRAEVRRSSWPVPAPGHGGAQAGRSGAGGRADTVAASATRALLDEVVLPGVGVRHRDVRATGANRPLAGAPPRVRESEWDRRSSACSGWCRSTV